MNENERQLLEGLRSLAAMEPLEASPRVEQTLRATFRARAEHRRRTIWASTAAALVATAAAIAVLFFAPIRWHRNTEAPQATSDQSSAASVPAAQYAVVRTDDLASTFYPLPEADELPPAETTLVVRVQLPVSSLQLMGFPLDEDASAEPVQAEVLLGQDGLARGVRVIQ